VYARKVATQAEPLIRASGEPSDIVSRTGPAWVRSALSPLLLYVALAVLLTGKVWTSPASQWIGGCCDPQQTMWFLRWIPYSIEHLTDPFVTGQINAPAGVNLMWNASIPLISFVAAPFTLTAGPVFAYNVAIVVSIALSAWCAFLLLRRYVTGWVAPVVGGAIYGFSPYVISHAAIHLNLTAVWAPPLFALLLDEILIRRRRSARVLGVLLGLLAVCQLLIAEELLATSAVAAAVLVVVLGATLSAPRADLIAGSRRLAEALVVASVTFVVVAAWPLAVQFFGPQRIQGSVQDASTFSTDLLNIVVPTRYQLIAPDAVTQLSDRFSYLSHEATGYLGLPLLVLVTVAVVLKWTDLRIRVAGIVALAMLVLSLGPRLNVAASPTDWPLPWSLVTGLPLLEHVLPGRLTLFMWLAVAVIVAVVIEDAGGRWLSPRARRPSWCAPPLHWGPPRPRHRRSSRGGNSRASRPIRSCCSRRGSRTVGVPRRCSGRRSRATPPACTRRTRTSRTRRGSRGTGRRPPSCPGSWRRSRTRESRSWRQARCGRRSPAISRLSRSAT
jgi:hypothetical protein